MKIELITTWYNESFLAPFFLSHYSFVDTIHVLLDRDTNDDTIQKCSSHRNVRLEMVTLPDALDDVLKIGMINALYRTLDCDWVLAPDADEFVFPLPLGTDIRHALADERAFEVVYAQMWQVYRHRTDSDLDPTLPAVPQRRHGDPNVTTGLNAAYVKPIIVKGGLDFAWAPGLHAFQKPKSRIIRAFHRLAGRPKISPRRLYGAHWAMADPEFAVARRTARRNHLSKANIENRRGVQHFDITEAKIRRECDEHLDDLLLF